MLGTAFVNMFAKGRNTIPKGELMSSRCPMPMATGPCDGCRECMSVCPTHAISVDDGWSIDLGRCLMCMDCILHCPNGSIEEVPAPDYALTREELVLRPGFDVDEIERKVDAPMFKGSLAFRELDTGSCNACEVELNCASNQFYDLHRFGIKVVASPRHADALVVTGPMARNMRIAAEKTYEAVPDPRIVIACGTCAISGGLFVEGDVEPEGVASMKPSILIPGCPPSPDRVIRSLVKSLGMRH
jgi:Ni,Fe-hydrogenase III small subunit/Pyruvate/2-oxoacid:ferredoxin oxidoreductase delta subunit